MTWAVRSRPHVDLPAEVHSDLRGSNHLHVAPTCTPTLMTGPRPVACFASGTGSNGGRTKALRARSFHWSSRLRLDASNLVVKSREPGVRIPPRPPQADARVDGEWVLRRDRSYWRLGCLVKTPFGATFSAWVVVRASDRSLARPQGRGPRRTRAVVSRNRVPGSGRRPEGQIEETGGNVKVAPPAHRHVKERQ